METTPVLPTRTLVCPPAPKKQKITYELPRSKSVGAVPIPMKRSYAFKE